MRINRVLRTSVILAAIGSSLLGAAMARAQSYTYGAEPSVAPNIYAITNARVVTMAGKTIEGGTIIIRNGLIVDVGDKVKIPADAKRIDGIGLAVYPGFIDAFSTTGMPAATDYAASRGNSYYLATIRADNDGAALYTPDAASLEARRKLGFGATHVSPSVGIFSGTSVVVSNGVAKDPASLVLRAPVMMHLNFDAPDSVAGYPGSLMGEIAASRQAMYDAQDAQRRMDDYTKDPRGKTRPSAARPLLALESVLKGETPLLIHADTGLAILRALKFDKEFGIHPVIEGGIEAYKVIPELKAAGATVLLSLNLPEPPRVTPGEEDMSTLQGLRQRAQAPTSAKLLSDAGVPFAFTTDGLDTTKFTINVRKLIAAGLTEEQAISALTVTPAHLLGLDRQLGTIEDGKIADLLVVETGTPFDGKGKMKYVFVDGVQVKLDTPAAAGPAAGRGRGGRRGGQGGPAGAPGAPIADVAPPVAAPAAPVITPQQIAQLLPEGVTPEMALQALQTTPDEVKSYLPPGVTVAQAITALQAAIAGTGAPQAAGGPPAASGGAPAPAVPAEPAKILPPPKVGDGLVPPLPAQLPASFVLRGATVWTVGPQGTLPNADVYVKDGKIAAVGAGLSVPAGTLEVNAKGKHVSPGMIDCHSHTAIEGGVNEGTNIVTAECRIQDVLNAEDINIYRELAGGTTSANVLHGSANAIGGQNCVVKWRWGSEPADMIFKEAPQGVKWALGENPKQSNGGGGGRGNVRYPTTRMGVEKVIREALQRARDYQRAWKDYKDGRTKIEPRRDLQLDALAEVLDGTRYVHCHSYRQDEILMTMRIAEDFGFRIKTFQHGLEGYKIADEIAKHGAGVSTFTDWWAYKIEAYDAIPYNGALLESRGVVTSFNSDSDELARRLNYEAAKGVHWGGMTPDEAIKLLTINSAKQLGIDKYVGSLEAGKDADIAVWSGDPLSTRTVCEKTFVDGKLYFDRAADLAARSVLDAEKTRLADAEKAAATPATPASAGGGPGGQRRFAGGPGGGAPGVGGPGGAAADGPGSSDDAAAGPPAAQRRSDAGVAAVIAAPVKVRPAAPAPTGPVTALVGGTVHPVSGPEIAGGVVLMQGGKITAVGAAGTVTVPAGAKSVDLTGLHVYPGLVDGNSLLGLQEIDSIRATEDYRETGDFNPDLRTAIAVNPDSEMLPVARQNGILSAASAPIGGTIAGVGSLLELGGWTYEDLAVDKAVGMYINFPSSGPRRFRESADHDEETAGSPSNEEAENSAFVTATSKDTLALQLGAQPPVTPTPGTVPPGAPGPGGGRRRRGGPPGAGFGGPGGAVDADAALVPLNDFFDAARRYQAAIAAEAEGGVPIHDRDTRFDAMIPVVTGKLPVIIRADTARDIRSAVAWARKQNVHMILLGGVESDKCLDLLKSNGIPVILDTLFRLPSRYDRPYDEAYTLPKKLNDAGIPFCLSISIGVGDTADVRELPYAAGMSAAFGLPPDVALKAITLYPAQILGEGDLIGSIETGKDATLIVTDGDPLEIKTSVKSAFVRGEPVDLSTKQTRLYDKYRMRPTPK